MSVCLVYPDFAFSGNPPLGLAYVAAVLEKNGVKVDIVDCSFYSSIDKSVARILRDSPMIVGISTPTLLYSNALRIAEEIKKHSSTFVCLGGPHPTIFPRETVSCRNVDFAVIGEGEITFLELVNALQKYGDTADIQGIAFYNGKEVIVNPPRNHVQDLDLLPFPARHLLPMESYIGFNLLYYGRPATTIIASRGCSYNCSFCQPTLRKLFGKKVRSRSPKNIVDEIEYLTKEYGIKLVTFHDDTFTLNKKWVITLCHEILNRGLRVEWICNSRANTVDEPLLTKMKEAGCIELRIGVESGNQWVLDNILRKGISVDQIRRAFRLMKKCGFKRRWAFFMIGSPGETREMAMRSMELAREIEPTHVNVSITVPLPGTDLWNIASKYGNFEKDFSKFDYAGDHALIETEFMPRHVVEELAKQFRGEFMEQEKLVFKISIAFHALRLMTWGLNRSLRNFSVKPMAQVLKLLSMLMRKFLTHRSLRVSRYHETDAK